MKGSVMLLFIFILIPNVVFCDSLWNNRNGSNASLFTDIKASKVGDIITILVVETQSVAQKAQSARDRSSNIQGEVKDWSTIKFYHGPKTQIAATKPIWEIDASNKFSGGGSFSGSYNIRGQITTRVVEVLPNNNLVIEGESEVWINSEKNLIRISGIVRPQDITANNTVLSTQVADAKIRIIGKGPLHDKTKRGILETILDWIWPF